MISPRVLLPLFFATAAFGDDWPQAGLDPARARSSGEATGAGFGAGWTASVAPAKIVSSPAVADGFVVFGTTDGKVHAFRPGGQPAWSFSADGDVVSSPAIGRGRAYVGTLRGTLYALGLADGAVRWSSALGGQLHSSPAVEGNTVTIGVGFPQKKVVRLNAETGAQVWQTAAGAFSDIVNSSAALGGGQALIGSMGGRFTSLDAGTGAATWTSNAPGTVNLSSPLVVGSAAYLLPGGPSAQLHAVDAATGSARPGFPLAIPDLQPAPAGTLVRTNHAVSSPVAAGGLVVFVIRFEYYLEADPARQTYTYQLREYAVAVNPAGPAIAWQVPNGGAGLENPNQIPELNLCPTPAAFNSGSLVAVASTLQPALRVLDATSGATLWTGDLAGPARSSPTFANGRLYVGTDAGVLHSFLSTINRPPAPPSGGFSPTGSLANPRPVLRWGAGSDPDGGALSYTVRVDDDGEVLEDWAFEATTSQTSAALDLAAGATYTAGVRVRDASGAWSDWSAAQTFTVYPPATATLNGTAYPTPADALAAAQPGETVQLGRGALKLTQTLRVPGGVTLAGVSAWETVLDAGGLAAAILVEPGGASAVENLAILGAGPSAPLGAGKGIEVQGAATIRNVVLAQGTTGLEVGAGGSATLVNATVVGNTTGVLASGPAEVRNSIVAQNGTGLSGDVRSTYNDLFGNGQGYSGVTRGKGDLSVSVAFADAASGDYRLLAVGPTTDQGDPADDASKEPQPNGGRVNMGAFGNTALAETSPSGGSSGGACSGSVALDGRTSLIIGLAALLAFLARRRRGLIPALLVSLSVPAALSAQDNTFTSGAGNWNTASKWSLGHVPLAAEVAYFDASSGSCTIDTAVNVLGIRLGQTGQAYAGVVTQGANAMTIGTSGVQMNFGIFTGGSGTIICSGKYLQTGGTFTSTSGNFTISFVVASSTDPADVTTHAWRRTAGAFNHNSGTVTFSGLIGATSNRHRLNGNGTPFFNLTHSGTAHLTLAGPLTVNGTILKSSTSTFSCDADNVTGVHLTINGGTFNASTGANTYSGNLTLAAGTFQGSSSNLDIGGNLSVSGGTFNVGSGGAATTTVTGDVSISGTGTLAVGSGALSVNGNWSKTGGFFTQGALGTVTFFRDAGPQTLNSGGAPFTNLFHQGNSPGSLTLTAPLTVTGTLTRASPTNGTFNCNGQDVTANNVTISAGTFSAGSGTISVSGNWSKSGAMTTFDGQTSTVIFTASAPQTLAFSGPGGFNHLTHSGSGTVTVTGSLTVGGNFTNSAGIFNCGGVTVTVGGNFTLSGTSASVTSSGPLTVGGNFLQDVGSFSHSSGGSNMTVTGSFMVNAGSFSVDSPALRVAGSWTVAAAATFSNSTAKVVLNPPSGSHSFNHGPSGTFFSITKQAAGTVSLGTSLSTNSLTVDAGGGTFDAIDKDVTSAGGVAVNGGIYRVGAGTTTVTNFLTVASGATLELTSGTGVLAVGNLPSPHTVNGTLRAAPSGGLKPTLKCGTPGGFYGLQVNSGTLDVTGLKVQNVDAAGFFFNADAVTLTAFRNVEFSSNATTAGSMHLDILANNGGFFRIPGCSFDASSQFNVRLRDDGTNQAVAFFEFRDATMNGARGGEDFDVDDDNVPAPDGVPDGSNPTLGVIEWVYTVTKDTAGVLQGFPTPAFDWNTFTWYSTYAVFRDAQGGTDRIYVRDTHGDARYSFDVDALAGNVVGPVVWDTEPGPVRVLYGVTTTGTVFKLIDDGSSLALPTSGAWSTAFTDAAVTAITSPPIVDANNVYFAGTGSGSPRIFAVDRATRVLTKSIVAASTVTTMPSWQVVGGATRLFLGSDAAPQAHLYRVDIPAATIDGDNTDPSYTQNVATPTALINDRLYAGDNGGRLHAVDALDVTAPNFESIPGWPFTGSAAAISTPPYVNATGTQINRVYYGDMGGNIFAVTPTPALVTGFPLQPAPGVPIKGVLFRNGVIAATTNGGKVYFIDQSAASVFRTYGPVGAPGVTFSALSYDFNRDTVIMATSDASLFYIKFPADPTPGAP